MSDEKKIIVDEDWKSRVAAEKAAAERGSSPAGDDSAEPAGRPSRDERSSSVAPATFEHLVMTLVTEAMIGLGQLPHPFTQEMHRDAAQARYAIDMLDMLATKTAGNLSQREDRYLRETLHQLRMAFIAVSSSPEYGSEPSEPA